HAAVEHTPARTSRPRPEPHADGRAEARAEARIEPSVGQGTLMISSKPPCEIAIDGRTTGLTTPQRSISLSAGNHRITLLNSEKSIHKVVNVQIIANTTAKIIEDLMQ
ncbi:MAG TPA: PEGA domain-containing protein, partial [Kofleriaceae bacterium]